MTICKNISVGAVNMYTLLRLLACVDCRIVVFDDLIAFEKKLFLFFFKSQTIGFEYFVFEKFARLRIYGVDDVLVFAVRRFS